MKLEVLNKKMVQWLRDYIPHPLGESYNWIWYGFPKTKMRYPCMGIFQATSSRYPIGIGRDDYGFAVLYEIIIKTNSNVEAIIDGSRYTGYKLCAYLASQVMSVASIRDGVLESDPHIDRVNPIRITSSDYDPVKDLYSLSVFIEIYVHLGL